MAADPLTKNTVDDLFDFDFESDDPFGEKTTSKPGDDKPTLSPRVAKRRADADDADGFGLDLGLDQEVKIKKRKPNPKLDEALYGSFRVEHFGPPTDYLQPVVKTRYPKTACTRQRWHIEEAAFERERT
jgi:hypothetical protein